MEQYLKEISRYELLDRPQEIALGKRILCGDEEAARDLAAHNLRFAFSVAKKYQNRGLPLADLVQEANMGLFTAATKFDYRKNVKFISYAVWWVRQHLQTALASSGTARVPLNRQSEAKRITANVEQLVRAEGYSREKAVAEACEKEGVAIDTYKATVRAMSPSASMSLDAPIDASDPQAGTIGERLAPDPESIEEHLEDKDLTDIVNAMLADLKPREQYILREYFGATDTDGYQTPDRTLESIGNDLSITRERVRQIKEKSLSKLRQHPLAAPAHEAI